MIKLALKTITKIVQKTAFLYLLLAFNLETRAQNDSYETFILNINSSQSSLEGHLQNKTGHELLKIEETASETVNSRSFRITQPESQSFNFMGYRYLHLKAEAILARIFKSSQEGHNLIYSIHYLKTKPDSSYKDNFVIRDEQNYYGERFYLNFHYEKALCFELLDSKGNLLLRAIQQGLNSNKARLYIFQKKKSQKIMPFVTTLIMMQISGTSPMKMRYNKVKF